MNNSELMHHSQKLIIDNVEFSTDMKYISKIEVLDNIVTICYAVDKPYGILAYCKVAYDLPCDTVIRKGFRCVRTFETREESVIWADMQGFTICSKDEFMQHNKSRKQQLFDGYRDMPTRNRK